MVTELRKSIEQEIASLKRKREQVNPEILDQLYKLLPLFRGMNASTVQAAALACGIKTEVNLAAMTALTQTLLDHERIMATGLTDACIALLEQALADPDQLPAMVKSMMAGEVSVAMVATTPVPMTPL